MLVKTPAEALPPTMESLVIVLRDPSLWPHDFQWDFRRFDRCAIGLAYGIWGDRSPVLWGPSSPDRAKYRGTFCEPQRTYLFGVVPKGYSRKAVTPEVVAQRIEKNFL